MKLRPEIALRLIEKCNVLGSVLANIALRGSDGKGLEIVNVQRRLKNEMLPVLLAGQEMREALSPAELQTVNEQVTAEWDVAIEKLAQKE
jgi:hypothetical protein